VTERKAPDRICPSPPHHDFYFPVGEGGRVR